ncbi:hypothetical protein [Rubritalea tangerina]|uniref:hypothetical protein n=1 Tax=Rubritalea tangerina TaxID=430798 RepID=UPI00361DD860
MRCAIRSPRNATHHTTNYLYRFNYFVRLVLSPNWRVERTTKVISVLRGITYLRRLTTSGVRKILT